MRAGKAMGIVHTIIARAVQFGHDGLRGPETELTIKRLTDEVDELRAAHAFVAKDRDDAQNRVQRALARNVVLSSLLTGFIADLQPILGMYIPKDDEREALKVSIDGVKALHEAFQAGRREGESLSAEVQRLREERGPFSELVAVLKPDANESTVDAAKRLVASRDALRRDLQMLATERDKALTSVERKGEVMRIVHEALTDARVPTSTDLVSRVRCLVRRAERAAPLPAATVEELGRIAHDKDQPLSALIHWQSDGSLRLRYCAMANAVAARVRRERCIIARAVAGGVEVLLEPAPKGRFDIIVISDVTGKAISSAVPAAEVPAELARMLAEVGA
jgi:hypothetical protein